MKDEIIKHQSLVLSEGTQIRFAFLLNCFSTARMLYCFYMLFQSHMLAWRNGTSLLRKKALESAINWNQKNNILSRFHFCGNVVTLSRHELSLFVCSAILEETHDKME
jgi:hypothetical protein